MTLLPPPLDRLPQDDQQTLCSYLVDAVYDPGKTIFQAGEPGGWCLFIDEGTVRLDVPSDHIDNDVTLRYLEAGSLLGEISLVDAQPRSAEAIAETEVRGRVLMADALEKLTAERPAVGAGVMHVLAADLAQKLRDSTKRLADLLVLEATDPEVEDLVARAKAAQAQVTAVEDAVIDAVLDNLTDAFVAASGRLAELTVQQTHIGNVPDKTLKNIYAARAVRQHAASGIGSGILGELPGGVTELVAPVGVVFAIIPMTNPVATAMFKVLSSLKTRNAIILSFHRLCLPLAEEVGTIIHDVLANHGLPTDLVTWVKDRASRIKTHLFMRHDDVDLILATGGPGMVQAAYSSGTPALGVGSGNAPVWIAADANPNTTAFAVVASKSFDNGLICGAEHNLVVDAAIKPAFIEALQASGAAVLDAEETERFLGAVIAPDGSTFRPEVQGQPAALVAQMLGIERPYDIRLIVFEAEPDLASPVTSEKIATFLSLFTVNGDDEALALSKALLGKMGAGHTAIVHSASEERIARFGREIPASRILVNGPGSQGVCGLTTSLKPSLTLGCGTFGGNSVTDNVTFENLRNIKRMARYKDPDASVLS